MAETIAAISTPIGEGGIGIVRVSGDAAKDIMRGVFLECPEEIENRHAYFGHVHSGETVIDEAIMIFMNAPYTYTGEDVFEIQAHGSIASLRLILETVLKSGARMAKPGEFTKLAFLNGKMDLTQAEAVIDLIKAKSDAPLALAVNQLEGRLGTEIKAIREDLLNVLAEMAVNIDFPDEDIEQVEYESFIVRLNEIRGRIDGLVSTAKRGRMVRDGIRIAILGRPNAGKSSLMNALLGENRVIVTEIPGTTRDTVEESITIGGVPVVLIDTAGLRETDDVVESIGIDLAHRAAAAADYIIIVVDASVPLDDELRETLAIIGEKKCLLLLNKQDLGAKIKPVEIEKLVPDAIVIETSLLSAEAGGADAVADAILNEFKVTGAISENRAIVSNARHEAALRGAEQAIAAATELLERGEAIEVAELESHRAFDLLGEIIGESAGEEVLDAVFSRFCLGK